MENWVEGKEGKPATVGFNVEKHGHEAGIRKDSSGVGHREMSFIFKIIMSMFRLWDKRTLEGNIENTDKKGNENCCSPGTRWGGVSLNQAHKWSSEPWIQREMWNQAVGWSALSAPEQGAPLCGLSQPCTYLCVTAVLMFSAFLPDELWAPCSRQQCVSSVCPIMRAVPGHSTALINVC